MKFKTVLKAIAGAAPLLLYAGAAFAATSAFASLNQPMTSFGDLMQNGVGYGLGIGGGSVLAYHFVVGRDWGNAIHSGVMWGLGGAAIHNAGVINGIWGGATGALIQPVLNHPITHLAIHAATRVLG